MKLYLVDDISNIIDKCTENITIAAPTPATEDLFDGVIFYTLPTYKAAEFRIIIAMELFQPKTDLFSTRTLIWVHFKTVHYFSQPIFSLFSYLKNT